METQTASKIIFAFTLCMVCSLFSVAQTFASADSAFAKAKIEAKPVLLMFTGSDWCTSCIRFDKKVMQDAAFKEYAEKHLVLITADFPQQKKLPKEIVRQNDSLAALYNADGAFPKFVLLNPIQKNVRQVTYGTQNATEFIGEVKKHLLTLGNYE
ncbi:MAG: hypothetical protein JWO03_2371 [Bacteroidetes bacterium]|nr:hypothetical protein [Bacteroidota bacterium]